MRLPFLVACVGAVSASALVAKPVRVTLVDEGGAPVANATVARLANDNVPREPTPVGKTDASGSIALDVDPLVRTGFLATADGRAPEVFGFFGGVPNQHRVAMPPADKWSGRVVNADGTPAAGATVELVNTSMYLGDPLGFRLPPVSLLRSTRADDEGRFAFNVDARADVAEVVRARAADGASGDAPLSSKAIDEAGDGSLEVRLDGHHTKLSGEYNNPPLPQPGGPLNVTLRVLDDATGQPIRDVTVWPGCVPFAGQGPTTSRDSLRFVDEPIAFVFTDGRYAHHFRVGAKGYATGATRSVKATEQNAEIEVRLKRETTTALTLTTPDGKPAAGASVFVATPTLNAYIGGGPAWFVTPPEATADAAGVARVALPDEPCRIAIRHDDGWAELDLGDAREDRAVALGRWATLTVYVGDGKPIEGTVGVSVSQSGSFDGGGGITFQFGGDADAFGVFSEPRARPGRAQVSISRSATTRPDWRSAEVGPTLRAGDETAVTVATGPGRIVGQFAEVAGASWPFAQIEYVGGPCKLPSNMEQMNGGERQDAAFAAIQAANAMTATPTEEPRTYMLTPSSDRRIGASGLWPGTYAILAQTDAAGDDRAQIWTYFVVPEHPAGDIDLGTVQPTPSKRARFDVGDAVPELKATTVDGKPFDLASLRGKWIYLHFWRADSDPASDDRQTFKDAHDGWAADGRMTVVSVALRATADAAREYAKKFDQPSQFLVTPSTDDADLGKRFALGGPVDDLLISPDGKLVARIWSFTSAAKLSKALGPPAAHK